VKLAHPLQRLQSIKQTSPGTGNKLQTAVDLVRARKLNWADIGHLRAVGVGALSLDPKGRAHAALHGRAQG
jgi:hypothetical protein